MPDDIEDFAVSAVEVMCYGELSGADKASVVCRSSLSTDVCAVSEPYSGLFVADDVCLTKDVCESDSTCVVLVMNDWVTVRSCL